MTATAPDATESPPTEPPVSMARAIEDWYTQNPGLHRCVDVARRLTDAGVDLGTQPTHRVAVTSRNLSQRADNPLTRAKVARRSGRSDVVLYGFVG